MALGAPPSKATVNNLANQLTASRLLLGIGVGGEYPQEFRACGVPLNERGPRTSEAIRLLRRLWTGEEISHGRLHGRIECGERGGIDRELVSDGPDAPSSDGTRAP